MCSSKPKPPPPPAPPAPAPVKDTQEAEEVVTKEDTLSNKKGRKRAGKKSLRIDKAGVNVSSKSSGLAVR